MILYDLQINRPVEVSAERAKELLKSNRFVTVPDEDYNVLASDNKSYSVKGSELKNLLNSGYELTDQEGFKEKPAGIGDSFTRFATGVQSQALGGIPLAADEALAGPDRLRDLKQIQHEGGLSYRAGQVTGFAFDLLPLGRAVGLAGKAAIKGTQLGAKLAKASKLTKAVTVGAGYGAAYGTLTGTAAAIREKDPTAVAEHAVFGAVAGSVGGAALRGLGRATEKIAKGWSDKAFKETTGISRETFLKNGVREDKVDRYMKIVTDTIDDGIASGKINTKTVRSEIVKIVKKGIEKAGKEIGLGNKQVSTLNEVLESGLNYKFIMKSPEKISRYGNALNSTLEVMSKLDSIYKLGVSRYPFFRKINKELQDISTVTIKNLSKFVKGFDKVKFGKSLENYNRILNKIQNSVQLAKDIPLKHKSVIIKEIKAAQKVIDKYKNGIDFTEKITLNKILQTFKTHEKKSLITELSNKVTTQYSHIRNMNKALINALENSKTSDDFIKQIRARFTYEGQKFSDFQKGLEGHILGKTAKDSSNFNDFFKRSREFYAEYHSAINPIVGVSNLRRQILNILNPTAASGTKLRGADRTLYNMIEDVLKHKGTAQITHRQLNDLRQSVGKLKQKVFDAAPGTQQAMDRGKVNAVYKVLKDADDNFVKETFKFYEKKTGKAVQQITDFRAQREAYTALSKVMGTIEKTAIEGPKLEMARVIAGHQAGAAVVGGAVGYSFGPLGLALGAAGGAIGSQYLPKAIDKFLLGSYIYINPFLKNITKRINDIDGYLTPGKLESFFHRTKDRSVPELTPDNWIKNFFGSETSNLGDVSKAIESSLGDVASAAQVFKTESDVLSSVDLTEVSDMAFLKKLHALRTISQYIPKREIDFFARKPKYSKRENRDFKDLISVVYNPKNLFKKMKSGSLSYEQSELFREIYPDLYMKIAMVLSDMLQQNKKLKRNQEEAVKRFLNIQKPDPLQDFSLELNPEEDQRKMAKRVSGLSDTSERSIDRVQNI